MSWSVSGSFIGSEIKAGLAKLREAALQQNPEGGDQFDAVAAAVEAIIASGSLGGAEKTFAVNMHGHGNPNHEPREGWANDCAGLSIAQL